MSQLRKSAQYSYRSKILLTLHIHRQRLIRKEDTKISPCCSRSPKYVELSHFTLLICRGRQRNIPRFKTHVHSYCSAYETFCLVALSLPLRRCFLKHPLVRHYFTATAKFQELSLAPYIHNIIWFCSLQKHSLDSIAQLFANEIHFQKTVKASGNIYIAQKMKRLLDLLNKCETITRSKLNNCRGNRCLPLQDWNITRAKQIDKNRQQKLL